MNEKDGILRRRQYDDFWQELDTHMQDLVKVLMENEGFREFLAWMLHRTNYFDVPLAMNAQTYFIEGRRAVGKELFCLIKDSCINNPQLLGNFLLYIDKQHKQYRKDDKNWIV